MMIILLYSAAILIETILFVSYLRPRRVEVKLPQPYRKLVKHLNIFHGNKTTNHLNVSDILF